jgi:hypothetical protein
VNQPVTLLVLRASRSRTPLLPLLKELNAFSPESDATKPGIRVWVEQMRRVEGKIRANSARKLVDQMKGESCCWCKGLQTAFGPISAP